MILYKPATAHSNSIVRPACTKCGDNAVVRAEAQTAEEVMR